MSCIYVLVWTGMLSGQDEMSIPANFMQNEIFPMLWNHHETNRKKRCCTILSWLWAHWRLHQFVVFNSSSAAFWFSRPCGAEDKVNRKPKSCLKSKLKPDNLICHLSQEQNIDVDSETESGSATLPLWRKKKENPGLKLACKVTILYNTGITSD